MWWPFYCMPTRARALVSCRNTCEMDVREFYYSRIVCPTPLCRACRASRFSSTATWIIIIIIIIVVSRVCTYLLFIQYLILYWYVYRRRQLDEGWNIILYTMSERTRGWGFIFPNHDVITYINILYIYIYYTGVCMCIILYPFNLFDLCTHVGQ